MSFQSIGQFPAYRSRRLRQSAALRQLVAETSLNAAQLVLPLFVRARTVSVVPGVRFRLFVGMADNNSLPSPEFLAKVGSSSA